MQIALDLLDCSHTHSHLFITPAAFKEVLAGTGSWQIDLYDNDPAHGSTPFSMVAKTLNEEQVN